VENIAELHQKLIDNSADVEPLIDQGGCGMQFIFKDVEENKFNVWEEPVNN